MGNIERLLTEVIHKLDWLMEHTKADFDENEKILRKVMFTGAMAGMDISALDPAKLASAHSSQLKFQWHQLYCNGCREPYDQIKGAVIGADYGGTDVTENVRWVEFLPGRKTTTEYRVKLDGLTKRKCLDTSTEDATITITLLIVDPIDKKSYIDNIMFKANSVDITSDGQFMYGLKCFGFMSIIAYEYGKAVYDITQEEENHGE